MARLNPPMLRWTPYIGRTSYIDDRLRRHKSGTVSATKARLPVVLATSIAFTDKYKAFAFEKYLKGGSGMPFLHKHLFQFWAPIFENKISLTKLVDAKST